MFVTVCNANRCFRQKNNEIQKVLCKMYNLTEVENRFGNSALDALFLLMKD